MGRKKRNEPSTRLIHGECLEVMAGLAGDGVIVDMVLTDPPYGTTRCKWDSIIPIPEMWAAIDGLIKSNAMVCLFGQNPFTAELICSNRAMFSYTLVWSKIRHSGFLTANAMPLKAHEDICCFSHRQPTYNPQKTTGHKRVVCKGEVKAPMTHGGGVIEANYDSTERHPTSVITGRPVPHHDGLHHPTQKPVWLMEWLIKTYTNIGETVLDFTMGSGSTGVAAKRCGRNFIGIEIDERYHRIAGDRILAQLL